MPAVANMFINISLDLNPTCFLSPKFIKKVGKPVILLAAVSVGAFSPLSVII